MMQELLLAFLLQMYQGECIFDRNEYIQPLLLKNLFSEVHCLW